MLALTFTALCIISQRIATNVVGSGALIHILTECNKIRTTCDQDYWRSKRGSHHGHTNPIRTRGCCLSRAARTFDGKTQRRPKYRYDEFGGVLSQLSVALVSRGSE